MAQTSLNSTGVASSGALSLQSNGTTEAIGISTGQVATLAQNPILTSGTANGVAYLNGSKAVTSGSALTFDGTTLKSPTIQLGSHATYYGTITHDSSTTGANLYDSLDSNGHIFRVNGGDKLYLNGSGNLGLGVTPSAWDSTFVAAQLGASTTSNGNAALYSQKNGGFSSGLLTNTYYSGGWKYVTSNPATRYEQNTGSSAYFAWYTAASGTAGDAISFTQAMTLDASGNLGVGTSSPSTFGKLAVYGSGTAPVIGAFLGSNSPATGATLADISFGARTDGAVTAIIRALANDNGNGTDGQLTFWTADNTASAAAAERMRIDSSGNLLVGTTALNGVWTTPLTLSKNSGTTKWAVGPWVGGENSFIVSTGATSGVYLNGTSATSWSSNSDETLKENLVPISNAAEKVCSLRAVTGNYIEDEAKTSHAFLIAQDVQAVLPEAVATTTRPDGTQVLGLAYTETIPLLVAAIKEQQTIIESLKARLDAANL